MQEIIYISNPDIVTFENKLIVKENTIVSFIGKTPPEIIIEGHPKIWAVIRCGAIYYNGFAWVNVTSSNSAKLYCDFYDLDYSNSYCKLYKRVRDDYTDYFSGKYKYLPGTKVTAIDWDPNPRIVCGNGLHLCATKEQSEQWNNGGRLLRCEVKLIDMSVFPYNINQVRCRAVTVLHSAHCHWLHFETEECNCDGSIV